MGTGKCAWKEPLQKAPTPTAGERLPDGTLLELVRDSSDATKAALLRRVGECVTIEHQFYTDDRSFVPVTLDPALLRQLRLPIKPQPCGPTQPLVEQISSILMQTLELTPENAFLETVFAVASFFSDCLPTRICLLLQGSANTEALGRMSALSWFCRHPLLLLDEAGIDQLPANLNTTRFFYSPKPTAKMRKLIANLPASGFGVMRNGSLLRESQGAVVIYSGSTDLGCACEGACLRMPVAPARRLLRPCDEECYRDVTDEIRAKLLDYRLVNYDNVLQSEFDVTDFTGPTRELARDLGSCLIDAPDLQDRLISLLRDQDESVRTERSAEMSPILESLMVSCHERRPALYVGEIAKTATEILSARGEWTTPGPKEVGNKLKLLGLHTVRLDAGGRGLKLTRTVCARIHQLARDYDVPTAVGKGLPGCPDCKQFFDQQSNSARDAHDAHSARKKRGRKTNEAKPA